MSNKVEIPLKESADEVIELDLNELPECNEVLDILRSELAPLHVWISLGFTLIYIHFITFIYKSFGLASSQ